ncbi:hypothetical protein HK102_004650 [Quaeritorhiza haematococci]|nr:hypothetical protein HK102_004650 [Quaeritorhiza haematococci]
MDSDKMIELFHPPSPASHDDSPYTTTSSSSSSPTDSPLPTASYHPPTSSTIIDAVIQSIISLIDITNVPEWHIPIDINLPDFLLPKDISNNAQSIKKETDLDISAPSMLTMIAWLTRLCCKELVGCLANMAAGEKGGRCEGSGMQSVGVGIAEEFFRGLMKGLGSITKRARGRPEQLKVRDDSIRPF